MERFAAIAREITALTGTRCALGPQRRVTGGCINECYCWPADAGAMFVKVAAPAAHAMFAAEAAGLAELEWAHAVRVPRVLASGHTERCAFLALEWIEVGVAGPDCEARLGRELAALHAVTAPRFGWVRDNTIGRTPQANGASGEPVLIDPAVYYGDRETDLAMTRLFGGFGERFYQAYQAAAPLAPAAQARCELYNLYHVLNHANLFGGGYARQARAIIEHLLAQARR